MKEVTISGTYISGDWLLIENYETLIEYMEHVSERSAEQLVRLIKSETDVERWDHMITRTPEGSILAATIAKCKIQGKSPVFEFDSMLRVKFMNMLDDIHKGRKLLVNKLGGYCSMLDDWEIVAERDVDFKFKPTHVVNKNTQYINLENDPTLEKHSVEFLESVDSNYSYVLNLHKYSPAMLESVFKKFIDAGGHTVFVYTTGINVPQMYEYFDAAINSGIKNFEFEFNSGLTDGINGFLAYAKSKCNVKVIS